MTRTMRSVSIIILLVTVCALCSCNMVTRVQPKHLSRLRKDMTPSMAFEMWGRKNPDRTFFVTVGDPDVKVLVRKYRCYVGEANFGDVLVAFKEDKLLFWGLVHEFLRSNDPIIRETGEKAIDVLSAPKSKAAPEPESAPGPEPEGT